MGFFSNKYKDATDKELQSALKALCHSCIAKGIIYHSDNEQYRNLLEEIFNRGLKPALTLTFLANPK